MHVDAAVHMAFSTFIYILLTQPKVRTVRYISQVIFSLVYGHHALTARRARLQIQLNKSIIYIMAKTRAFFEAHCS